MGGINWAAMPYVVDILGVKDVELLIRQLVKIRNHYG